MYVYIIYVCLKQDCEAAANMEPIEDDYLERETDVIAAVDRSLAPFSLQECQNDSPKEMAGETCVTYPSEVDAHCPPSSGLAGTFGDWARATFPDTFGEGDTMPRQLIDVLEPACRGSRMTVLEASLRMVSIKNNHPSLSDRALQTMIREMHATAYSCIPVDPDACLAVMRESRKFRPKSYSEAKRIVDTFGQDVQVIDRCEDHCCLYVGDKAELTECPSCGKPRYPPACGATNARKKRRANAVFLKFNLVKTIQSKYRQSEFASKIEYFAKWHGRRQLSKSTEVDAIYCGTIFKEWLEYTTEGWSHEYSLLPIRVLVLPTYINKYIYKHAYVYL